MKDVNSVQQVQRPQQFPQQLQRQEPIERLERPERVERTERSVESRSVTVTTATNEFTHNVQERGRQEAVLDSEHRLLYMRNGAVTYEDSRPVMQTLTYTQHSASVTTAAVDGSQPLLDVRV